MIATRHPKVSDLITRWLTYELQRGGFRWDNSTGRYRSNETGRLVAESKVISTIDRFNDGVIQNNINNITERLIDGRIDLATWQRQMARELKDGWLVNAMAGRGGRNAMTQADYGRVGGRLRFEYDRLNGFANAIRNGDMTAQQIRARALLYADGPRTGYYDGRTAAMQAAGFVEEQRFLGAAEHCEVCIDLAALGRQPIGSLPEPGTRCLGRHRCKCTKDYFRADEQGGGAGRPLTLDDWLESMTPEERRALTNWGRTGGHIRAYQAGIPLNEIQPPWWINSQDAEAVRLWRAGLADEVKAWESLMGKGVIYDGKIYRGMSNVPNSIAEEWLRSGEITLNNDQSASYYTGIADDFRGLGSSRSESGVMWEIKKNKTGVNLFDQTKVTSGGKSIAEGEVVIRNGARYRVVDVEFRLDPGSYREKPSYATGDNWVFDDKDYFEGHPFSWPNNPPPGWTPGDDLKGYYYFTLEEI